MATPAGLDDELDEERVTTREVGKARDVPDAFKHNPQGYLEATHHPYAPFTGDTIDWNSWVFDDATTFEGTTRQQTPHGKGVMTFGKQGSGGGFATVKPGDKYEGEFFGGYSHGVGMYTGADGEVYKGEFAAGMKEGCGAFYDLKPWRERVAKGMDPVKAWRRARKEVQESVQIGTWNNDVFLTGPTDLGSGCSLGDIQKTMREVDSVVAKARMFSFKPDGDATFFKSHLLGAPIRSNQHPLHYPHGTLFMAPGPAGQTAAVPKDRGLRKLMLREFHNYRVIHSQYNFEYTPASDSVMAKAMKWWNRQEKLRKREEAIQDKIANRQMRKITGAGTAAAASKGKGSDEPSPPDEGDQGEDFDESDLLADAASAVQAASAGPLSASAFGSIAMSHRQAHLGLHRFFDNLAKRAPRMPKWAERK